MWPGMIPILHDPGVITPGQFGPIRRDFDRANFVLHGNHIQNRNTFRDAHDQFYLRFDRFEDGICGVKAEEQRSWLRWPGFFLCFANGIKDWQISNTLRAAFSWSHAAHKSGAYS